jgi:putative transposase
MPRANRIAPGGWVFHVLNRGNARRGIFAKETDYRALEGLLQEMCERLRIQAVHQQTTC